MSQYQKWPEEKYPKKCPVHNCYIFRPINSQNYQPNIPTYIVKPNQQIYQSKNYTNNQDINPKIIPIIKLLINIIHIHKTIN